MEKKASILHLFLTHEDNFLLGQDARLFFPCVSKLEK